VVAAELVAMVEKERKREEVGDDMWGPHVRERGGSYISENRPQNCSALLQGVI
jgi:hypothetical protein